jgi:hypothetical protein
MWICSGRTCGEGSGLFLTIITGESTRVHNPFPSITRIYVSINFPLPKRSSGMKPIRESIAVLNEGKNMQPEPTFV